MAMWSTEGPGDKDLMVGKRPRHRCKDVEKILAALEGAGAVHL
jgi:hypothetical protein